eukprot:1850439-Rhodomonas_salina.3
MCSAHGGEDSRWCQSVKTRGGDTACKEGHTPTHKRTNACTLASPTASTDLLVLLPLLHPLDHARDRRRRLFRHSVLLAVVVVAAAAVVVDVDVVGFDRTLRLAFPKPRVLVQREHRLHRVDVLFPDDRHRVSLGHRQSRCVHVQLRKRTCSSARQLTLSISVREVQT